MFLLNTQKAKHIWDDVTHQTEFLPKYPGNCSFYLAIGITSRSRELIFLYSVLVRQIWSTGCSAGLPSTTETQTYWRQSSEGPWRWLRDRSTSFMRKGWESWDRSAWRRESFLLWRKVTPVYSGCLTLTTSENKDMYIWREFRCLEVSHIELCDLIRIASPLKTTA